MLTSPSERVLQTKSALDEVPRYFFAIIKEMAERLYLGEFELVVMLVVIRLGEDAYGVLISREIEQQTGRAVAFGTVYATLERLQKKGLVSSRLSSRTRDMISPLSLRTHSGSTSYQLRQDLAPGVNVRQRLNDRKTLQ